MCTINHLYTPPTMLEQTTGRTKLLTRSKTAGSIKVHSSDFTNELVQTDPIHKYISKDDSNITPFQPSYSCSNVNLRRSNSSNYIGCWLSEKSIRNLQRKTDFESKEMANMYHSLLDNEERLQKDLDDIITYDQIRKDRKLQWLLQKWYEKTYIPLDNKICQEMNGFQWKTFDQEKRKQFIKYLKHRNEKGHIFLDIYEEAEYDPMSLNKKRPGPIKAVTEKLEDPLLHQQYKRNEEDRVVYACDNGIMLTEKQIEEKRLPKKPLVPLGRHDTECSTWLDMKLYDIQSEVRLRSQDRLYGVRNISNTCLHDISMEEKTADSSQQNSNSGKSIWKKRRQFTRRQDTLKLV